MLPTYTNHNAVGINKTVESNIDLIPSLLAAHALSGWVQLQGIIVYLKEQSLNNLKKLAIIAA